jgi:hypothetical protein
MDISIEEFNVLSDRTVALQVRIAELERALSEQKAENVRQQGEIERMKVELVEAQNVTTAKYMENIYLRNLLILSGERIKSFMQHLKNIDKTDQGTL